MASGEFPALDVWRTVSTSIWPLNSSTIPSSFRRRFINSSSRSLDGCFDGAAGSFGRGRRGALPGAGKIHGIWARRQFEQGMCLSHRTLSQLVKAGDRCWDESSGPFSSDTSHNCEDSRRSRHWPRGSRQMRREVDGAQGPVFVAHRSRRGVVPLEGDR